MAEPSYPGPPGGSPPGGQDAAPAGATGATASAEEVPGAGVEPPAPPRGAARWTSLGRRLLRRVAASAVVVWGAATLAFIALHVAPGDTVRMLLGAAPADAATIAEMRRQLGLNHPVVVQYFEYLGHLLQGDLGTSYQQGQPVGQVIGQQFGATAQLTLAAAVVAIGGALVVAVLTAHRPRIVRAGVSVLELTAASMPTFWLGILLLVPFSFDLRIFPVAGNGGLSSLVLPAVALAVPIGAVLSQVMRESLEVTLEQPFILTARARGMREAGVRLRHALRHAALPLVTLSGWTVGHLLGGAVIVETVFARQGLGRVALAAINGKDFPVVIGVVVLSALIYVVVNTLVDLFCLVIDPRLREGTP